MPQRELPITLVVRTLDEEVVSAEPLLFAELHCCDSKTARLRTRMRELLKKIAEGTPVFELYRRELAEPPNVDRVRVNLPPPRRRADWIEPVQLEFDVVRWRHGTDAHLAFVPALGIEVIASKEPELRKRIPDHIIAALRRSKAAESLYELALTQRVREVALEPLTLSMTVKSPKQREKDKEREVDPKPTIESVGLVLNDQSLRPAYQVESLVRQIAETLAGKGARSVLLVGPSGVGKTAAVHELVRTRASCISSTPFWATSGSRLVAGMSGFGMWQQRTQRLCQEAAKAGAILHLGNLIELMEVGRGGAGGQGIAGFLRPYLGRGEILAIAECTPEQLPLIEREDPHLLEVFHTIRVEEPSPEAARQILQSVAQGAGRSRALFEEGWLGTLDRLHRRYGTYSASPGRPVRFLENLIKDLPEKQPLGPRDVIAAFARETGLPLFMLDPAMPLDLRAARDWFALRVVGQDRAVDLVVDLLATVKAALSRPRRPIASLLFIGPTGVGKTEMAKSVAEYFFGDRNRLTRFDMSEFADTFAVRRLVGGSFGAEGLLTAKVREQPFSVILFDEFEKADASFFDLLLQVLGEGRLTDAAGRLGDFSNAIIAMTSNLGAEAFGRGVFGLSTGSGLPDPERHFTDEVRAFLRPELFNRIDRIVPFLPLDPNTVRQIARRELSLARQRDGFRLRGVSLDVSDDALGHLVSKGYDVRYGARPLKRAIERELLAPLSDAINSYPADVQLAATAQASNGTLVVTVRAKVDETGKTVAAGAAGASLAAAAAECSVLRRQVQKLRRCSALLAVQNQLFLLEREQDRAAARTKKPVYDEQRVERIRQLRAIVDPTGQLVEDVFRLENQALTALYEGEPVEPIEFQRQLPPLWSRWDEILLALLALQAPKPHEVTLAVFGHKPHLWELARAYHSVARKTGCSVQLAWFSRYSLGQLRRHPVQDPAEFLQSPDEKAIGVALALDGPHAFLRFGPESGIHAFGRKVCLVDSSEDPLREYVPPARVEFPEPPPGRARRDYDTPQNVATDAVLGRDLRWSGRGIEPVIADAVELQLRQAARALAEQ